MQHPNHQALLIVSGAGVLAAAVTAAAGILIRRHVLIHRSEAGEVNNDRFEFDPDNPSIMEYLVSHNTQGF